MSALKGGTTIAGYLAIHAGNLDSVPASASMSGTVKIGNGLSITDGVVSANYGGSGSALTLSRSDHWHSYDNYQRWILKANSEAVGLDITSGSSIDIKGSGATSISRSGNVITISSTDTNTTYSVFTSSANGLAPSSGGGTTKYLRADGTWQVPPDTDTNTTYAAGSGLSLSGTTFNHSNSVTGGTVSDGGSARTLVFGGTFNIPSVTYDNQGHITSTTTIALTMPANPNTNTATAADNILDGSNSGTQITYAPYAAQQAKLSFDTSTTNPTRSDRLNLNGYFYATQLNSTVATGTSPLTVTSSTIVANLNADMLDGLHLNSTTTNNQANRVMRTDGSGYANFGWINTTSGASTTQVIARVYASNDGYIRYYTLDNFAKQVLVQGSYKNSHTHDSASDFTITDPTTLKVYKIGVDNGEIFLEEVV